MVFAGDAAVATHTHWERQSLVNLSRAVGEGKIWQSTMAVLLARCCMTARIDNIICQAGENT